MKSCVVLWILLAGRLLLTQMTSLSLHGTGKTLQTITCILDNRPKVGHQRESHRPIACMNERYAN
jgi:hypothetical protein